jgi:hypothetical protein
MPKFRLRAGYFMGTYYADGTELELNDKQAKYGLLSGQLEAVNPPPKKQRAQPQETTVPPRPQGFNLPRQERIERDEAGEYSSKKSVGGRTYDAKR